MDFVIKLLAGAGLAIPCGLNPYLPLLVVAIAGVGGKTTLYGPFDFLGSWPVVIILALLVGIDIFADKFPQVEKLYLNLNYVIRPIAGAIAFSAIVPPSQIPTALSLVLGLILAEGTYLLKNGWRPAMLARSKVAVVLEPLISMGEDVLAAGLALLTLVAPVVGGPLAILLLGGMGWWWLSLRRQPRPLVEAEPTRTLPKSS